MSAGALKGIGIGCFVLLAILMFVAWERHQDNKSKFSESAVDTFRRVEQEIKGWAKLEPRTPDMPAATKYALFFGVLAGIGGVVCFVMRAKKGPGTSP